ncbi:ras-like protein family member 11A [Amia ocellicauda]|uniref:ras-like protein family member 11A n=1 Tax=Amia ocellicauda TaxID=2972642 RepID=UPI0034643A0A|nr:RSLBA protein [Amia calva]
MRLMNMSNHLLLAPIPESPDYLLQRDIKIAVLGSAAVGKTAMVVRFLTKRFIGDYEPNTGNLYSRLMRLEGEHLAVQIQDTPCIQMSAEGARLPDLVVRSLQWADCFLLVYSITDYSSYQALQALRQHLHKAQSDCKAPVIVVGNKGDLLHARQVSAHQGLQLAGELGAVFLEISTSETCEDVSDVFQHLCKEASKQQPPCVLSERRRSAFIPRPKSPNMQDLKRRFKQALSSKAKPGL